MALIKKCKLCTEKGLFLSLTNGLCSQCHNNIINLETEYTKLLQKVATCENNKSELLLDITKFINKFSSYDGFSQTISMNNLKNLTDTLNIQIKNSKEKVLDYSESKNIILSPSNSPLENIASIKETGISESKIVTDFQNTTHKVITNSQNDSSLVKNNSQNIILPNSTNNNLTLDTSSKKSTSLKLNLKDSLTIANKNINENPITAVNKNINTINTDVLTNQSTKIKNIIEPFILLQNDIKKETFDIQAEDLTQTLKTSVLTKNISLNLKLNSNTSKSKTILSNIEKQKSSNSNIINLNAKTDIKKSALINTLKRKCTTHLDIMNNSEETIENIAKSFFTIKKDFLPTLEKENSLLIDNKNLIETLNTFDKMLCLRCKKNTDELFDFFNYVAIFVQTTGLSPTNSDVIEISALKISYGKIIDEFHTLVNPIKTIKRSVELATGISNSDVENAKTLDMILPKLLTFVENYPLVAFNSKTVELFLNTNLKKLGMSTIEKSIISLVSLYRIRYKNYHGTSCVLSDISTCCSDLLSETDLSYINKFTTFSRSYSYAIYKLHEILKYKYK
ncbi:MAG: 3'-5' exonuclease [Sarcina sp.]